MSILYEEYSPWKVVHFMDRLKNANKYYKCVPISLQLSITDRCSNKCIYCYLKKHNMNQDQLDFDVIRKLLYDAKSLGVKAVEITGGGDPLAHPRIWDIVKVIKDLGMDLGLITNGHGLNAENLDFATWVRISLDSYNPITYKKIRNANMVDLSEIEKLCKSKSLTVGACSVLNQYNYSEVYDFVCKSKKLGFSNVWLKPVEGIEEVALQGHIPEIKKQLEEAKKLVASNFKIFMPDFDSDSSNHRKEFTRCFQQHVATFVGSNGSVYPCCSLQISEKYALGNINNTSIIDILENRKELKICNCPLACFWAEKNKFMNYLVAENPKHVNFM